MKPTDDQIKKQSSIIATELHGDAPSEGRVHFRVGFIEGAQWAISQMQPEWVAVNSPADLPTDNKSYWCEMKDGTVECRDGFTIRHFGVLRYTPVVKPQPPTK